MQSFAVTLTYGRVVCIHIQYRTVQYSTIQYNSETIWAYEEV